TERFVYQLRSDFRGDDDHPTFRKFFPDAPSATIRLALEAQIDAMKEFPMIAEQVTLSSDAKELLKEIVEAMTAGRSALEAREKAATAVARISLKIQGWRESANAARRSLENALDTWATAHAQPRDYADRFFPAPQKTRKAQPSVPDGTG